MTKTPLPTREEILQLVAYLPKLYADGFEPVLRWDGGKQSPDGPYYLPWPVYDPLVEEFFRFQPCWIDYQYDPEVAWQMLRDDALVRSASLEQIKSMLTFCVRGERFSDGHWGTMITNGSIRRLLERLRELAQ